MHKNAKLHPPLRVMPATLTSIAGGTMCKVVASATTTADGLVTVAVVVIQRKRCATGSPGGRVEKQELTMCTLSLISQKKNRVTTEKNGTKNRTSALERVPSRCQVTREPGTMDFRPAREAVARAKSGQSSLPKDTHARQINFPTSTLATTITVAIQMERGRSGATRRTRTSDGNIVIRCQPGGRRSSA